MRSDGLLRKIPVNARPLLASVGAGLSLTAAIAVIGLTALVATGVELVTPMGDGAAAAIRLADVPRVDRSAPRAADRNDVDVPVTRSAAPIVVPRSPSIGGSRVPAGERRSTPSQHRARHKSAAPKRVQHKQPPAAAPVAQTPASTAPAVSNTTAVSDPTATGTEVSERPRTVPPAKPVRSRSTPAHAKSWADSGRDTRTHGHDPTQTASAPSVSPPKPQQRAARGARPDHPRGKAVGHVAPVAPPQPAEPPASADGPVAEPPGHGKRADEHPSAPGADRGRGVGHREGGR